MVRAPFGGFFFPIYRGGSSDNGWGVYVLYVYLIYKVSFFLVGEKCNNVANIVYSALITNALHKCNVVANMGLSTLL